MFTHASFGNYSFIHDLPLQEGGEIFHRKHMHPGYELVFVAEGHVGYQVELEHFDLQAEDLLIIRPGDHHYPLFPEGDSHEFYVLRFDAEDLPRAFQSRLSGLYDKYCLKDTDIPDMFRSISAQWELFSAEPELLHEVYRADLGQILASLLILKGENRKSSFRNESLRRIFEYINANYLKIAGLGELEEALHMSRSGISKTFLREMEVPVMQYIRNRKCVYAHRLLTAGTAPKDAAEQSGFEDYSAFYRNYVKIYGTSPRHGNTSV